MTYAASVWVLVKGKCTASISLGTLGLQVARKRLNYVTQTNVRHSAPNDPRTGTNYQRLKVLFDVPPGCAKAVLTLEAEKGGPDSAVEFDDVRMVESKRSASPDGVKHWFYEDFENVDQGYGPFTCCPGERTHLSEANPPYTNDVINGQFSLKSRDGGRVLRTLPCTIRFQAQHQVPHFVRDHRRWPVHGGERGQDRFGVEIPRRPRPRGRRVCHARRHRELLVGLS